MTPKEIDHHLIDADLTAAEIKRRLEQRFGVVTTTRYVSMILHGERTGYKLRPKIAKIARLKVGDIPLPPKQSDLLGMGRSRGKETAKQGGANA